ncbi:putative transcriptional regulator [Xanthomonas translucens pv. poae]|uniref:Putative transcriptional regulator n=1 Tax=Xanthomonas graminis pv. poae TaxID=227946 RepID=A0A0K3A8E9_9XANT|nr:LysR family transcriptional regulator [Xanthomonas translucens]UKE63179.1 LysR family transcriptional regulator [Xanthomonas translucens pv. poae]CTP92809.1 putative transcriptional regulator [Xanthomonas translucens pv. poae]
MVRETLNDLLAFVTVAREASFTRAAAQLGLSQSALSHSVRGLETRLGVRLLTRTTRSVAMTEAGERLFDTLAPRLEEIDAELAAIADFRDRPAGTIRITTAGHAADAYVWPKLAQVLPHYPDLKVELTVDYGLADIVAQRYDIGIRLGDQIAKDMIAVPISPPQRMAVVAVPDYFVHRTAPLAPAELAQHNCIGLRLPTHGGLLPWDFAKDGREVKVRVDGQWTFNASAPILRAALAGAGMAFLPETMVLEHIAAGRLRRVLDDWCDTFDGYYAYYPSRRQSSSALKLVIDALRHPQADRAGGATRG